MNNQQILKYKKIKSGLEAEGRNEKFIAVASYYLPRDKILMWR